MSTRDDVLRWDRDHVWHPFTQAEEWEADPPLVIAAAEGVYLIDLDGRRYLDGVSSLWTNVHGHRHLALDAAVRDQLDRVAHSTLLGLGSVPSATLARRLVELVARLPGEGAALERVFYSDSGSTAVEVALKMAFQAQQQRGQSARTRVAALQNAYHGDTLGAVSVGGIELFHGIYRPLLFPALRLPAPERPDPVVEAACLREAERIFAAEGHTLAALVVEPLVQGAAGMLRHSPAFLDALMGLARSAGVLIIADEVATGFGRTGTIFALEQCHHRPDLLCLAKGITGGYLPLAVTMTTASVYEAFRGPYAALRTFFHGHTYTANPLACAAALANLELFADGSLLASLPEKIQALEHALAALPSAWVSERRQTGLMAGALLRDPPRPRFAHEVCLRARRHGVIVRPLGDLIVFMPPLAMRPDQIAETVQAVGSALAEAWASGPP